MIKVTGFAQRPITARTFWRSASRIRANTPEVVQRRKNP
jgi:hypothetical protein